MGAKNTPKWEALRIVEEHKAGKTAPQIAKDLNRDDGLIREVIGEYDLVIKCNTSGSWPEIDKYFWTPTGRTSLKGKRMLWIAEDEGIKVPQYGERKAQREAAKSECYDQLPLELPKPKQEPKHTKLAQAFRLIAEWLEDIDA